MIYIKKWNNKMLILYYLLLSIIFNNIIDNRTKWEIKYQPQ